MQYKGSDMKKTWLRAIMLGKCNEIRCDTVSAMGIFIRSNVDVSILNFCERNCRYNKVTRRPMAQHHVWRQVLNNFKLLLDFRRQKEPPLLPLFRQKSKERNMERFLALLGAFYIVLRSTYMSILYLRYIILSLLGHSYSVLDI